MSHYTETISKFLSALKVDTITTIKFQGRVIQKQTCICGQAIEHCYVFYNKANNKKCVVGKNCLRYIADYLNWP